MSNNHHTAIATGANADDTVFNAPLSQLDQTITDMLDGSEPFTALKAGNAGALDATASAEIDSTTKGFIIPRMTSAERDLIGSPAEGLLVFNTSANVVSRYNGSAWGNYGGGTAPLVEIVPPTSFNTATLVISAIDQGYHDLILRISLVSSGIARGLLLRPNGVSSGYAWAKTTITFGGGAMTHTADDVDNAINIDSIPGTADTIKAELEITFRNYAATGVKLFGSWVGTVRPSGGSASFCRGAFEDANLAAIESLSLLVSAGGGDTFIGSYALYGLGTPE